MSSINSAQMKRLHALLNELELMEQKSDLVLSATAGRSASSRELSYDEAQMLIGSLQDEKNKRIDPMRKKIIHLLCLIGYVDDTGKPNMKRINYFVQNRTGKNNPGKKQLSGLNAKETLAVLNVVTMFYHNQLKRQANGTT